jgi:hypothetical protein
MSKNKNTSYRVSNTPVGTKNRQGDWIPERDDDGKIIYSNSIKITIDNPTDDYQFPSSLESSRISDIAAAKSEAGETLKTSNSAYRLDTESVQEFEATDDMPHALQAIYRPVGLRFTGAL